MSVNTVAAIMAEEGLIARERPKRRNLTKQGKRPAAPDLVEREFTADAPDEVWCGDVTMIPTGEGPLYLAIVIDLFSRRMLGYSMTAHHDTELTKASLLMAFATRGGSLPRTIFHGDRGSEYTGSNYAKARRSIGVLQSMGRVACALDNAVAESFHSTLKTEFTHRRRFATRAEARQQISSWITNWYNQKRRHSWCAGISPITHENNYNNQQEAATIRSAA